MPDTKETQSSLEKALDICETLAGAERGLSVSALAQRVHQPAPTVHRLLAVLKRRGFVRQDEDTSRYSLTLKMLDLSFRVLGRSELRLHAGIRHAAQATDDAERCQRRFNQRESKFGVQEERLVSQELQVVVATQFGVAAEIHVAREITPALEPARAERQDAVGGQPQVVPRIDVCRLSREQAANRGRDLVSGSDRTPRQRSVLAEHRRFPHQRRAKRHDGRNPVDVDSEFVEQAPARSAGDFSPEELLTRATLDTDLQEALDALPEAFRQAVWLRDVEELTYAEIAGVLEVPIGTVMSRISRGRRALYDRLQKRVDGKDAEDATPGDRKQKADVL